MPRLPSMGRLVWLVSAFVSRFIIALLVQKGEVGRSPECCRLVIEFVSYNHSFTFSFNLISGVTVGKKPAGKIVLR
jgi:hypothetical protein